MSKIILGKKEQKVFFTPIEDQNKMYCYVCGTRENLKFYPKVTIKKTGNPVTYENAFVCLTCDRHYVIKKKEKVRK
jgi:hypothetical protein